SSIARSTAARRGSALKSPSSFVNSAPRARARLARARGALFTKLDGLFRADPRRAAVLRAMLLGDRSFVDSRVVTAFQKTAAYHVLVVAGLHVGALAVFFFWLGRRFRLPIAVTSLLTIAALAAMGSRKRRPSQK